MEEKLRLKTPQGKLIGTTYVSVLNAATYYAFYAIPYARPPIGSLRFMPPEPWEKWTGTRKATNPPNQCVHRFGVEQTYQFGDEDCLYLNVFTPQPPCDIKTPLPVIVLIHCGGHAWGSGNPEYFGAPDFVVHHNVIWVTFNFRLHILGFLNLEIPNCAGNMGLKDQVMALRWVKEHIKYFGGDPNNVTIYGSSSGATDVHLHTLSPMSKGLFHKVIMQSGCSLSPVWSFQDDHIKRAFQVGEKLGFKKERNKDNSANNKRLLRFLKGIPADKLADTIDEILAELKQTFNTRPHHSMFHPTAETFENGAFLQKSPRELIYNLDTARVPIIWGITALEGLIAFLSKPLKASMFDIIKCNLWTYKMTPKTIKVVAEKVKSFYNLSDKFTEDDITIMADLYTDMWFAEWNYALNFQATRVESQPIYIYLFTFSGKFNYHRKYILKKIVGPPDDPSHNDDSSYFTYMKPLNKMYSVVSTIEGKELNAINNMATIFTDFVKNCNPNETKDVGWRPYHPDHPSYLDFGDTLIAKEGLMFEERVKFWNQLIIFIKKCQEVNEEEVIEKLIAEMKDI